MVLILLLNVCGTQEHTPTEVPRLTFFGGRGLVVLRRSLLFMPPFLFVCTSKDFDGNPPTCVAPLFTPTNTPTPPQLFHPLTTSSQHRSTGRLFHPFRLATTPPPQLNPPSLPLNLLDHRSAPAQAPPPPPRPARGDAMMCPHTHVANANSANNSWLEAVPGMHFGCV